MKVTYDEIINFVESYYEVKNIFKRIKSSSQELVTIAVNAQVQAKSCAYDSLKYLRQIYLKRLFVGNKIYKQSFLYIYFC